MNPPRHALRAALALGLVALLAPSASAQTNYLAVSEVSGGTNGLGEVAIYQQNADGTLASTTPYATITSQSNLVNPMGLAFSGNDLYIAGLGTSQIVDFNVVTKTASTPFATPAGYGNLGGMAISGGNLFVSSYGGGTKASPGAVLEYSLANPGAGATIFKDSSGNTVVGPTGLAVHGSTVYVNSSQTGLLYSINTATPGTPFTQATFFGLPSTSTPLSAPAGMTFGSVGGMTYLYETNFFSNHNSTNTVGISSYDVTSPVPPAFTTGGYNNPGLGGPADIVFGPGVVDDSGPQVLVSDFGDGLIYQYAAAPDGSLAVQSTYLSGISPPSYLAEFTTSSTFAGSYAVPEPSGVALLALGGGAGLLWRRRLLRSKALARA